VLQGLVIPLPWSESCSFLALPRVCLTRMGVEGGRRGAFSSAVSVSGATRVAFLFCLCIQVERWVAGTQER
jgi:hypothetical protein